MKMLMLSITMLTVFTSAQAISLSNVNAEVNPTGEEVEKVKIKVKSVWMKNKEAKNPQAELAVLEGIEEVYVCPFRSKAIIEYNPEKVKVVDMIEVIEEEGYDYKL